jgi:hypothetical protein
MKTQAETILTYLQTGRGITQGDSARWFHIYCLAERIRDLRKRGLHIRDDREAHYKGYHVRYFLVP